VKTSAEIIVSSDEGATLRQKKARTSGLVLKARLVTAEVKKPTEGKVELLNAIREQNSLLRDLLIFQEQTSLAMALQAQWARPMTNYLGWIAHGLEARNEAEGSGSGVSGSGGSGSGSGGNKGKGKEKEHDENAENESGNRDGGGDEDGNGEEGEDGNRDSDGDAERDETMGLCLCNYGKGIVTKFLLIILFNVFCSGFWGIGILEIG
jgi:hypothetical protein